MKKVFKNFSFSRHLVSVNKNGIYVHQVQINRFIHCDSIPNAHLTSAAPFLKPHLKNISGILASVEQVSRMLVICNML